MPDDIFFTCFCTPLENQRLHDVRKRLSDQNGLIDAWLSEDSLHVLEDVLSSIEIENISESLRNWLRSEFKEEIEDIKRIENSTKFSAFSISTTGLFYHWSFLNSKISKSDHFF